ncbi:zinc ribbon domain-containing protein (plasmid) [Rhizobium sp. CB3171]|uniref:zinc ribbon domain-containing protein n=1 Tax=Rhizobium sp. CB3171 TaxID=3039157 RepID=UPI0024B1C945|nr:zinc ribbon domain-containing protein [Rhizobium sp. CB3171]WFU07300.1 zinc ribbon domain-containing protein [Rhizobium sp. CB3171]
MQYDTNFAGCIRNYSSHVVFIRRGTARYGEDRGLCSRAWAVADCGHCGRRLRTHYRGRNAAPGYHCAGKIIVEGRGVYCLNIGGVQIDEAVAAAFLEALEPARLTATIEAAERLESDREATLKQWRLDVERAQFAVNRAERRYRAVDPDNRLVARSLEREWEEALRALEVAKTELARREEATPRLLSSQERANLLTVGVDLVSDGVVLSGSVAEGQLRRPPTHYATFRRRRG